MQLHVFTICETKVLAPTWRKIKRKRYPPGSFVLQTPQVVYWPEAVGCHACSTVIYCVAELTAPTSAQREAKGDPIQCPPLAMAERSGRLIQPTSA